MAGARRCPGSRAPWTAKRGLADIVGGPILSGDLRWSMTKSSGRNSPRWKRCSGALPVVLTRSDEPSAAQSAGSDFRTAASRPEWGAGRGVARRRTAKRSAQRFARPAEPPGKAARWTTSVGARSSTHRAMTVILAGKKDGGGLSIRGRLGIAGIARHSEMSARVGASRDMSRQEYDRIR